PAGASGAALRLSALLVLSYQSNPPSANSSKQARSGLRRVRIKAENNKEGRHRGSRNRAQTSTERQVEAEAARLPRRGQGARSRRADQDRDLSAGHREGEAPGGEGPRGRTRRPAPRHG